MYFIAHSFYAYLVPAIVVGVLLTCQSLNPEYKTTLFFQYFQEKNSLIFGSIRYTVLHRAHWYVVDFWNKARSPEPPEIHIFNSIWCLYN